MPPEALPVFSPRMAIELFDGLACAFLAAAASCRTRNFGGNIVGALALGCICGLLSPLLRETFMHGPAGSRMVLAAMPVNAFIGAIIGVFAPIVWEKKKGMIFFWLDSLGIGLMASLATILSLGELGIAGSLAMGLCAALLPGMCRDICLGDVAMFIERNWYASSAALACITATAAFMVTALLPDAQPLRARGAEAAILSGCIVLLAVRYWKDRGFVD